MEEWKEIPGHLGYWASTLGNIKSMHIQSEGKIMKQSNNKNRYCTIHIGSANGKSINCRVHRLVAITFMPIDNPNDFVVNHINGDRYDNRLCNLEWCTQDSNLAEHWFKEQAKYKRALDLINKTQKIQRTLDEFADYILSRYI